MSHKTRWIMFGIAVVVFVITSYTMVVYALGYKYDFTERQFVQTGSFRVVANTGAEVFINGRLNGTTSFLGNSFSKGRLLPRTYTVRLQREGYYPWQKNVIVEAGFFTDFPKVVLLPTEFVTEVVPSISFGFPMPDSNVRPNKNKSLAFDEHTVSIEWLSDTDEQPFHRAGDFETVFGVPTRIDDVQWYRDHEHLLLSTAGKLYFYEIDVRGGLNRFELTTLEDGQFYYDRDENAIYKIDQGQIVKLKLS